MQSGKAHVLYKVNKKGPSNTHKMSDAVKVLKKLLTRVQKEGMTKWLANAIARTELRLKKYSIDIASVKKEFGL